jgi:metallo-beta-lactamase family protein
LTPVPTLRFLGACGTVTGSKFLLEAGSRRVLVDCGVFQGSSELKQKNWTAPSFSPGSLNAVALTHAHIVHTGYVPRLGQAGYDGPVLTTPPTAALLHYLWPDAARLHEEDARYANKERYSRHRPALPFFDVGQAQAALRLLRPVPFHEPVPLSPELTLSFRRVGHILGASFVVADSRGVRVVFSGDVGQRDAPILKDPEPLDRADYLIVESTYGDRLHPSDSPQEALSREVEETVGRRGTLLIPAFAVGRAQELLYHLRALQRSRRIPEDLPIFLDSPMATSVVDLYCRFDSEHDLEMQELQSSGRCPIDGASVTLVREREESKQLNDRKGPMVIISASGMLAGGRILHHLKRRLPDPDTTLVFVGFQAQGTLGRRILEGAREARIHGETVPVRARVKEIPALSAHADQKGLIEWVGGLPSPPRAIYLVHGEASAREALAAALRTRYGWNVVLPKEGDEVRLQ